MKNNTLSQSEIDTIKSLYKEGMTNISSIISTLYSQGNDLGFTLLKKEINRILNIKEVFKSIGGEVVKEK